MSGEGDGGAPGIVDGLKSIKASELTFQNIGKMPCAKTAFLTGIASALIVGSSRFMATRRAYSAGNWGMLAFVVSSSISWEYCHLQRKVAQQSLSKIINLPPPDIEQN